MEVESYELITMEEDVEFPAHHHHDQPYAPTKTMGSRETCQGLDEDETIYLLEEEEAGQLEEEENLLSFDDEENYGAEVMPTQPKSQAISAPTYKIAQPIKHVDVEKPRAPVLVVVEKRPATTQCAPEPACKQPRLDLESKPKSVDIPRSPPPLYFDEECVVAVEDGLEWPLKETALGNLRDRVCQQIQPVDFELLPEFFHLDRVREALTNALRRALEAKQGVNILLVGQPGTGKTHALRAALRQLPQYRVIELDGKHIADDVMAARELSRLLCLSANAAVNQSILTLEDGLQDIRDQFSTRQRGSFSDHLNLVLRHLEENEGGTKLLFLLKNFDRFCARGKNTFLYTLLDQAHQREGKFALVAEYCELDCVQKLDKRLRSRLENVMEFHFPCQVLEVEEMLALLRSRLLLLPATGDEANQSWNALVEQALLEYKPFLAVQLQLGCSVGYILSEIVLGALTRYKFGSGEPLAFSRYAKSKLEHPQTLKIKQDMLTREELVLLFTAVYLQRVKKLSEYSFETLYKHSTTIRKGGIGNAGIKDMFVLETPKQNISFVQFESLLAGKFLTRRSRRGGGGSATTGGGGLVTKAMVSLSYDDVDQGLLHYVLDSKDKTFPLPLLHWAKQLLAC